MLQALIRRGQAWADRAACSVAPYDGWKWWTEPRAEVISPGPVVDKLKVCATCPVRLPCLLDALTEVRYETWGIIGGSTTLERRAARGDTRASWDRMGPHDRAEAIEQAVTSLEATLDERIASWEARAADVALHRRRRVLKRFPPGNPGGPGRGHVGPIGRYAAAHGVSRSTAWRRLRAS